MGGIDLVVTDLDGTLWSHEGAIHPRVLEAWRSIEVGGIPVLVATGRRVASTREPLARSGLAPDAVVLDGAIGLSLRHGGRFHQRPMPTEVALATLALFRGNGLSPVVYVDHTGLDAFVGPDCSTNPGHLAMLGSTVRTAVLDEVVVRETVLAFGLVGVDMELLRNLVEAIVADGSAEPRLNPSFDFGGGALMVVDRGLSKWDGIVAYCATSGLDPTRVLAIGDGSNDVEMLEHAKISCSLEGSTAAALSVARHVVSSVGSGGWAEILALI